MNAASPRATITPAIRLWRSCAAAGLLLCIAGCAAPALAPAPPPPRTVFNTAADAAVRQRDQGIPETLDIWWRNERAGPDRLRETWDLWLREVRTDARHAENRWPTVPLILIY